MEPEQQREALERAAADRGESLAALSRLIGRNPAYLQQYVTRGSPRVLAEADRRRLARYLGVSDAALGGPVNEALVAVARVDAGAAAGRGRVVDSERARPLLLDPALLRRLGVRADMASTIRVEGASMEPTLCDGDEILVDGARRLPGSRPAIHVFRRDGLLAVKRLRLMGGEVELASDNPDYGREVVPLAAIDVVGRVVWMHRALL
ncbi:phage repressor protein C with HTH and peptisase S24 domain [Sphingomonas sp. BE123]|uniref:S24 family peptidase n=1 Tax=unclassified Sphingomonas TaxID=196159 RepID=UPI00285D845A|nr:S24 family peptidase [Sphingomonas sp. BE123]MDR6853302.1 phage repressor protein C with HTH and peptisase S24 domain [Sphingomonas sp. BE123]